MPANTANLQSAIDRLTAQVAATVSVEDSAEALIAGFSAQVTKAVTDALTADNAADQGSVDAATAAIQNVTAQFSASSGKLGTAVTANTTPPPAPAPAPTA